MPRHLPYSLKLYSQHKRNAKCRGISFLLTYEEWAEIWEQSGHFHERGNRGGCYVMARIGDQGAYAKGNVEIIPFEQNTKDAAIGNKHFLGKKHSGETLVKLSLSKLGNTHSLGHKHTDESRAKMSAALKGRVFTDEWRAKLSEANRKRGKLNLSIQEKQRRSEFMKELNRRRREGE